MGIKKKIQDLRQEILDPRIGLPYDIFLFISSITPLINVDLLIKDEEKGVLLVYRDDDFYTGWHIPGGIIRFKETIADRIMAVAQTELGCSVKYDETPIKIEESIHETLDLRGHFISILFNCELISQLDSKLENKINNLPIHGQWRWHKITPIDFLDVQEPFRKYLWKD